MPRVSFKLEFLLKPSPAIVYKFLTTPDCLIRWFCDVCKIVEDHYIFEWEGEEEVALLIDDFEEELVRFKWLDSPAGEYLEFKTYLSDVTNETILEITGFCDDDEVQEEKEFWRQKVEDFVRAMGG